MRVVDDVVGHMAKGDVQDGDRRDAHRMEDVARVLNQRFCERLSLSDVGEEVGLSVFHLCRLFKRRMGTTIHRYLTRLRLRTALEMLGTPGVDLTRVALALGFSSHSHFTDCFRREYGITPSRFRDPAGHRDLEIVRRLMTQDQTA